MEKTLYDWAAEAAAALGLEQDARWVAEPETVREVLALASELAHGVTRPAAPVGAFLVGVAVGARGARSAASFADARAAVPTHAGAGT